MGDVERQDEGEQRVTTTNGDKERNLVLLTYILFGAGIVTAFSPIAGIILSHIKVRDVQGTVWESHYQWLIRTFWIAFAAGVVSSFLVFIFIGVPLMIVIAIWFIYRLIKGFLRFNDNRPIDDPTALI